MSLSLIDPAETLFLLVNPVIYVPLSGNELFGSDLKKVLQDLDCASVAILDFMDEAIDESEMLDKVESTGIEMDSWIEIAQKNIDTRFGYE